MGVVSPRYVSWVFGLLAGLFVIGAADASVCDRVFPSSEPRTILGLYDGRRESSPRDSRLHQFFEFPLNHFGFHIRYVDISKGKLPELDGGDIAGVVSWFDGPLDDPGALASWAVGIASRCGGSIGFVVLGQTGMPVDAPLEPDEVSYLRTLGLERTDRSVLLGDFTSVSKIDDTLLEWETDFGFRPGRYASLRAITAGNSLLRLVAPDNSTLDGLDLVVLHRRSAYVEQSATLDADDRAGGHFWIVDPYELIQRTLASDLRPVPDVTTLHGRRIYFETVSPEGWLTSAPVRTFDEEPRMGADLLLSELIAPFPNLPVSVSVAIGDIDPGIGGKSAIMGRKVAEDIFQLPQTSVATSGRSLVRYWNGLDAAAEAKPSTTPDSPDTADERSQFLLVLGRSLREAFAEPGAPAEAQLSDGLRKYGQDAFSLVDETSGALQAARALAVEKAEAPLFLWAGDGRPTEAALAAVRATGSAGLGGGPANIGKRGLSLSELTPFSVQIGSLTQVYNALPGDAENLGYPSAHPRALHDLALLLDRTDRPARLKPFQLAYSAGSAIQFGTRSAIERLKTFASTNDAILPVTAAQYVAIVDGFSTVRFRKLGARLWSVSERGSLQTIRFDEAATLSVDLSASRGVIGARRLNDALYVALDPGTPEPLIAIAEDRNPSGMVLAPGGFAIWDTNLLLASARLGICKLELVGSGWGEGSLTLRGDPGASYRIRVTGTETDAATNAQDTTEITADAEGLATARFPTQQGKPEYVTVLQSCSG